MMGKREEMNKSTRREGEETENKPREGVKGEGKSCNDGNVCECDGLW